MYGYKTLAAFNTAMAEAGLGRYQLTQDEWTYGIDSKLAYTFAYMNLEGSLASAKADRKAKAAQRAKRPTLTAANYVW